MPRCRQHVAIVRIDFSKPLLLRAGQMQRVTGSNEDRSRQIENGVAGLLDQFSGDAEPVPNAILFICFEVLQDGAHFPAGHVMLSDVPLEDGGKLQPGDFTGG